MFAIACGKKKSTIDVRLCVLLSYLSSNWRHSHWNILQCLSQFLVQLFWAIVVVVVVYSFRCCCCCCCCCLCWAIVSGSLQVFFVSLKLNRKLLYSDWVLLAQLNIKLSISLSLYLFLALPFEWFLVSRTALKSNNIVWSFRVMFGSWL